MTAPSQVPGILTPESQSPALNPSKRVRVFAATVAEEEHAAMLEAVRQAGYERPSVGARVILMAFAKSAEVRDAVARWARLHPEVR